MTRIYSFIFAGLASFAFIGCGNNRVEDKLSSAKWVFDTDTRSACRTEWVGEPHRLRATNQSKGFIEVVDNMPEDKCELSYALIGRDSIPAVNGLSEGDYFLFCHQDESIEPGCHIEIDAVITSSPDSPKYFIAEILDGNKWESSADDLMCSEDGIKYSFMCSGDPGQHNSFYQTFRLDEPADDGSIRIRFRVCSDYSCSGKSLSENGLVGWTGFADHGYVAGYIQNFGTDVPEDTLSVLCIGNSFTYYGNSPSMLKEIAWSQGHYLDITANMKGGQNFGQHRELSLTKEACKADIFDFAFLQDQSRAAAKFAVDSLGHWSTLENYLELCRMVHEKSPECTIFLEHTWPYSKDDFAGFSSYESFNNKLKTGAKSIARHNGASVSPIGDMFLAVMNAHPDIQLYHTDNHHQSNYGSYLKACLNYLLITGKKFNDKVADCGLDPIQTAQIRNIVETSFFGENFIANIANPEK